MSNIAVKQIIPEAIEGTNIRDVKDSKLKTLIKSIENYGLYYPIKVRELTEEEKSSYIKKRIEEIKKEKEQLIKDKKLKAAADKIIAEASKEKSLTNQESAKLRKEIYRSKSRNYKKLEEEETFLNDNTIPLYGIIDGHSRFRAYLKAKKKEKYIEVTLIENKNSTEEKEIAFCANISRNEMTTEEKALCVHKLMTELNMNTTDIARKLGYSRQYINRLSGMVDDNGNIIKKDKTATEKKTRTPKEIKSSIENKIKSILEDIEDTEDKGQEHNINKIADIKELSELIKEAAAVYRNKESYKQYLTDKKMAGLKKRK